MLPLFLINLIAIVGSTVLYYDNAITEQFYIYMCLAAMASSFVHSTMHTVLRFATLAKEMSNDN